MKILFDNPIPFLLGHGGYQNQIELAKDALERAGVDVEWLRWWDGEQTGNVIQYYGIPSPSYVQSAHAKGIKVVSLALFSSLARRPKWHYPLLAGVARGLRFMLPEAQASLVCHDGLLLADACIANTHVEVEAIGKVYGVPVERTHFVPNGVEEVFFRSPARPRSEWLCCTATITGRKRICELAQAAIAAKTPIRIVGKPYSESDPYYLRFRALAQSHPEWIRHVPHITDRAELAALYRSARGFVLLSAIETRSLSAEEAAACECPLLLSDMPWARDVFPANPFFLSPHAPVEETARVLRTFYDAAPTLPPNPLPTTWDDVAGSLIAIYRAVLEKRP